MDSHFRAGLGAHIDNHQRGRAMHLRVQKVTAAAAIIVLLITATLTIPPLRAIAQEIIDTLFNRADADEETLELGPHGIVQLVPYFYGTVEEAQAEVDFDILVPTWIPEGVSVRDVTYSPEEQLVSISYSPSDNHAYGLVFSVDQGPVENGWSDHPYLNVGASAELTSVMFEGVDGMVTGEFVKGWWWPATPLAPSQSPPDSSSTEMVWRSDIAPCRLRWQESGMLYEIWVYWGDDANDTPSCALTQDEMVAIAESM